MTEAEDLLGGLAIVWVQHWLEHGGSLIVNEDRTSVSIGMRMDWRRKPTGGFPVHQQRLWHDGWIVGRWRMLSDLSNSVPGLRQAIIDHVAICGQPYGDGRRMMVAN